MGKNRNSLTLESNNTAEYSIPLEQLGLSKEELSKAISSLALQFSQSPNAFSSIMDQFNRSIAQYKKEHEHWKEKLKQEILTSGGINNISPEILKMAFRKEYTYNIAVALMGKNGIFVQFFKEVYGEDFLHSLRRSSEEREEKYTLLNNKIISHFSYLSNRKKYLQDKLNTCSLKEKGYAEDSLEEISIEQGLILSSMYVISKHLKPFRFCR